MFSMVAFIKKEANVSDIFIVYFSALCECFSMTLHVAIFVPLNLT